MAKLNIKANNQGWTGYCTLYATINAAYQMINAQNDENYPQNIKGFKALMSKRDYFAEELSKEGYPTINKKAIQKILKGISDFEPEGYRINSKRVLTISKRIPEVKADLDKGRAAVIVTNGGATMSGETNAYLDFSQKSDFLHMTAVFDYDETGLIGLNSHGKKWGYYKNGTFKIKWEDFEKIDIMYFLIEDNMIFKDVSSETPLADHIKWLADEGISTGYDKDKIPNQEDRCFKPNQNITRAEFAAMLHRYHLKNKNG
jgi:hypothetical protein